MLCLINRQGYLFQCRIEVNLFIIINLETTRSKYFTKQYIILYLCTDQNHHTCSESEKKHLNITS